MPAGTAGNDAWEIRRWGEVNVYDGRDGVDTLSFERLQKADFRITQNTDGSVNVDSVSGASAFYRLKLTGIEILLFNYGRDPVDLRTAFSATEPGARRDGTAASERLTGTGASESMAGLAGHDSMDGAGGADTLMGGEGDDRLLGGAGDDRLDGGAGRDVALYAGDRADHQMVRQADGSLIVTGPEGNDVLVDVERVVFKDRALAFDVEGTGGKTYRLYKAAYDRAPDAGGVGFWMHYLDGGFNMLDAANNFLNSEEFRTLYDRDATAPGYQEPTTELFVEKLYRHALQREPEGAGYQFWVDAMNNKDGAFGKAFSRGEVLIAFAESAENKAKVVGIIENGFEYQPFVPPAG